MSSDFFAGYYKFVLKIGFVLANELDIGRGGQVSAWGTIHMAAAFAGCRMALVVSDCKDKGNTLNYLYLPQRKLLTQSCLNVRGHLT